LATGDGSLNVSTSATEICVTCLNGQVHRQGAGESGTLAPGIFHTEQVAGAVDQIRQLLHLAETPLPGDVVVLA
jgi:hypothetical protein